MTPEDRIHNFHEALKKDNPIWYDGLGVVFPNKDVGLAVKRVWLIMHSEGKITRVMDWKEARNLVNKTLTWQEPKTSEGFEKAVPVDIHPQALTGEARAKRLQEYLEAHLKCAVHVSEKTDKFEQIRGQWEPPEGQKYQPPDPEVARIADLKVQYGRLHTDKITGKKLPGSPDFDEWKETV